MVEKQLTKEQLESKANENSWLLDCVLSFMRSPRWRAPVVSFIEEYCLVFDNEEENKLEYTTIHKNFIKLVDELLCELIAEVGIDREQFYEACELSKYHKTHSKLVQQILAVEDFASFKRMMIRKNQEFNELALKQMLEKDDPQNQDKSDGTDKQSAKVQALGSKEEDEMMRLAMQESERMQNQMCDQLKYEEEMLAQAIAASQMDEEERVKATETTQQSQALQAQVTEMQQKLKKEEETLAQEEKKMIEQVKQLDLKGVAQEQKQKELIQIQANIDQERQRLEKEKLDALIALKNQKKTNVDQQRQEVGQWSFGAEKPADLSAQPLQMTAYEDKYSTEQLPETAADPYDGLSFSEVLRQKREKLEQKLKDTAGETPQSSGPSKAESLLQQRKKALAENRAKILAERKNERDKELLAYNEVKNNPESIGKNDLHSQFLQMEAERKKESESKNKPTSQASMGQQQQQYQQQNQQSSGGMGSLDNIQGFNVN